ncbi:MAG: aminotransferase class V-fold PLP-dependent enzyme [Chloroflexi bacterium]|nr:aminotransferase class V-fold PLP-dependent enzyme [Chloroflexota bacterium]
MSLAPHKFYGPKGVGILYVREGIELDSILTGGGQEDGRRAGTSNVAFAVGGAKALALVYAELEDRVAHYRALTRQLIDGLLQAFPDDCILTGHATERLAHNAELRLPPSQRQRFTDASGHGRHRRQQRLRLQNRQPKARRHPGSHRPGTRLDQRRPAFHRRRRQHRSRDRLHPEHVADDCAQITEVNG